MTQRKIQGEVKELVVIGSDCDADEFIETFEFIKDDDFFSDIFEIKNKEDFRKFYLDKVLDTCVARIRETNRIVMVSYVFWNGYKSLCLSAYVDKEYRKPSLTTECCKLAIKYYFNSCNANRIDAIGRMDNRLSRLITTRLGFKRIGIIPKFLPHNGVDKDYYYSTILR